jgi:membrane-associated protease RseP (regulator of RpoE activity)
MPLSARDRRALSGGGLVIAALFAYLLWPEAQSPPAPALPVQAPPAIVIAPPPAVPAAPTAVDVSRLRLFGVMASGAVFGMADGSQRFVPVGREVVPGATLLRVELHHAVLATAAGEVRLGFDGVDQAAPAATPAATAQGEETLRYRLGLEPRIVRGRIDGFTIRPGASLPALARAGIQPGDVILRVNGAQLDEERREELAWQIANSGPVEFEIERAGRPLRLTLQSRSQ